ncbi:MAG: SDR family oxidoreductase [Chloroflexota bacterium]|nr:SDR family oxidoreductase [Chloroflexota bacterium]
MTTDATEGPEPGSPFRLDGRVALVTGAGSADGIGQAIARVYAAAGAAVALADQDVSGAQSNARSMGDRALGVQLDVTQPESVAAAVAVVERELGSVDILVNNAGITRSTVLWETSLEEFDQVLAINLRGGFVCLQSVLTGMMTRRWGRVIWLSSIAGKQGGGVFGTAHYAASKAGVIGLCQAAARQLGPYGITSNAIAPGLVLTGLLPRTGGTDMAERLRQDVEHTAPLRRAATALDIAYAALFLASEGASYITGEVMDVNGGAYFD